MIEKIPAFGEVRAEASRVFEGQDLSLRLVTGRQDKK